MSKQASTTAWAFLVVSDASQAETLPDQQSWANEAAKANGWTITKMISGVSSGKLGARPLTLKMIDELEKLDATHRPARLLMIRLERLGRGDGLEALEVFVRIRRLGIVVHTRLDGDVGYNRASELLMPVLRFFIGGMENEVRRDKLISHYDRCREAKKADPTLALTSSAPYGLDVVDRHYVPKEPEAGAVRLIYELRGQGYGGHLIGKRMAQVAPPMTLPSGAAVYLKWTGERVRRLLVKDVYRHTIVDEETWQRAQRPLREICRNRVFHPYPLRGALRCECGHALIGSGKRARTYRYYMCRNHLAHDGHMRLHRTERIEARFVELLERLRADDALLKLYVECRGSAGSNAGLLHNQLAALRSEDARLEDRRRQIFSAFEDGALKREDLQWRLDDLKVKESELRDKIDTCEADLRVAVAENLKAEEVRELIATAGALWQTADHDDQVALAKAVSRALGGITVTFAGEMIVGERTILPVGKPADFNGRSKPRRGPGGRFISTGDTAR